MEYKLNLITPCLYSKEGPSNCKDDLVEEFADYVKHRADNEFNIRCKYERIPGLAFIYSFEDFENRFLIHSEYAVIIASTYSQKALNQFIPRLLVFLTAKPNWQNRIIFICLGEVKVLQNLVTYEPIQFSPDKWEAKDEQSWKSLFNLVKMNSKSQNEEICRSTNVFEEKKQFATNEQNKKKYNEVCNRTTPGPKIFETRSTQGPLVNLEQYSFIGNYKKLDNEKSFKESGTCTILLDEDNEEGNQYFHSDIITENLKMIDDYPNMLNISEDNSDYSIEQPFECQLAFSERLIPGLILDESFSAPFNDFDQDDETGHVINDLTSDSLSDIQNQEKIFCDNIKQNKREETNNLNDHFLTTLKQEEINNKEDLKIKSDGVLKNLDNIDNNNQMYHDETEANEKQHNSILTKISGKINLTVGTNYEKNNQYAKVENNDQNTVNKNCDRLNLNKLKNVENIEDYEGNNFEEFQEKNVVPVLSKVQNDFEINIEKDNLSMKHIPVCMDEQKFTESSITSLSSNIEIKTEPFLIGVNSDTLSESDNEELRTLNDKVKYSVICDSSYDSICLKQPDNYGLCENDNIFESETIIKDLNEGIQKNTNINNINQEKNQCLSKEAGETCVCTDDEKVNESSILCSNIEMNSDKLSESNNEELRTLNDKVGDNIICDSDFDNICLKQPDNYNQCENDKIFESEKIIKDLNEGIQKNTNINNPNQDENQKYISEEMNETDVFIDDGKVSESSISCSNIEMNSDKLSESNNEELRTLNDKVGHNIICDSDFDNICLKQPDNFNICENDKIFESEKIIKDLNEGIQKNTNINNPNQDENQKYISEEMNETDVFIDDGKVSESSISCSNIEMNSDKLSESNNEELRTLNDKVGHNIICDSDFDNICLKQPDNFNICENDKIFESEKIIKDLNEGIQKNTNINNLNEGEDQSHLSKDINETHVCTDNGEVTENAIACSTMEIKTDSILIGIISNEESEAYKEELRTLNDKIKDNIIYDTCSNSIFMKQSSHYDICKHDKLVESEIIIKDLNEEIQRNTDENQSYISEEINDTGVCIDGGNVTESNIISSDIETKSVSILQGINRNELTESDNEEPKTSNDKVGDQIICDSSFDNICMKQSDYYGTCENDRLVESEIIIKDLNEEIQRNTCIINLNTDENQSYMSEEINETGVCIDDVNVTESNIISSDIETKSVSILQGINRNELTESDNEEPKTYNDKIGDHIICDSSFGNICMKQLDFYSTCENETVIKNVNIELQEDAFIKTFIEDENLDSKSDDNDEILIMAKNTYNPCNNDINFNLYSIGPDGKLSNNYFSNSDEAIYKCESGNPFENVIVTTDLKTNLLLNEINSSSSELILCPVIITNEIDPSVELTDKPTYNIDYLSNRLYSNYVSSFISRIRLFTSHFYTSQSTTSSQLIKLNENSSESERSSHSGYYHSPWCALVLVFTGTLVSPYWLEVSRICQFSNRPSFKN